MIKPRKRRRAGDENEDLQKKQRRRGTGGGKNTQSGVQEASKKVSPDKNTHIEEDGEGQTNSPAKSVLEELEHTSEYYKNNSDDDDYDDYDNSNTDDEESLLSDDQEQHLIERQRRGEQVQGAEAFVDFGRGPPSRDPQQEPLLYSRQGRGGQVGGTRPHAGSSLQDSSSVRRPPSRDPHYAGFGRGNGYGDNVTDMLLVQRGQRAFSYRTAKTATTKAVRERVQVMVKTVIFRAVKFITCEEHIKRVMEIVLDQEKPDNPSHFVRCYKTIVVGALNTKRSTCEQSASEAVMKLLKAKDHLDELEAPPYDFHILCKLRQSHTPEEKEAFLWFVGEFLQTVCGKRAWGSKMKYRSTISDAISNDTGKAIVTVTDEAFALLLYDAYIDKWIKRYHEEKRGEMRTKRLVGKYTKPDSSASEYGGWCDEGIQLFNDLVSMVQEDRNSRNAGDAEEWLLSSLREQVAGTQLRNERDADPNHLQRTLERANRPAVNAFIEL